MNVAPEPLTRPGTPAPQAIDPPHSSRGTLDETGETDARHRAAEIASDWIWEIDATQRLTFLSKRFGDTSGIPWSQMSSRLFSDLVEMGFDREGMYELRAMFDSRAIFQNVVHCVDLRDDAVGFWSLSGKPIFDAATGGFAGYHGSGTDVTAAMEHQAEVNAALVRAEAAEQEARQARQRLVDAIDAIHDGFVRHDAEDRLVLYNARYGEMCGLPPDQMVPGVRFEETLRSQCKPTGDVPAWVTERMHRALAGDPIEQHLSNGRWLLAKERRTSDGGTVGIIVDVSQTRRLEAQERERERTAAELRAARLMQMSLVPSARLQKEIFAKSGLDIGSRNASCSELGDDLWGLTDLGRGRVGVFTLDVSGHGITAALNTFRLHALIHELGAWSLEPAKFLRELNLRLVELVQPGTFATMFYGIVDSGANCVTYAAAGSPSPVLRAVGAQPLVALDSDGFPLEVTAAADCTSRTVDFGPGGMLCLYSDILTDFADHNGQRSGEAGAFAVIERSACQASAEGVVVQICSPLFDPPDRPLSDDLTVVCIMRPRVS